eukprot:11211971-Lingulodinium_polyedra.AAC.1
MQQLGFETATIVRYGLWWRTVGVRDVYSFAQRIRQRADAIDAWPRAGPQELGRVARRQPHIIARARAGVPLGQNA